MRDERISYKSNNVTVIWDHLVFPGKDRRMLFEGQVETVLTEVCLEIDVGYDFKFLDKGVHGDHVLF